MRRADILDLMSRKQYPSVSIMLPTHRGHPDNQQDPIRLKNLLDEARQRLDEEVGKRPSWPLVERLEALADEIDWRQNEDGLVLFASEDFGAWYRLPFPVEERVAVDRTFETRDILYALHRMPRYRVLSLAERPTRLFEGTGTALEEVRNESFPISRKGPRGLTRRPDAPNMRRSNVREAYLTAFLTEVDRALEAETKSDPLPLVLIGARRMLSSFEDVISNLDVVAVRVEGSYDEAAPSAIADLAWPPLQEWLHGQRQAVTGEVTTALGAKLLASGLDDTWKSARAGQGAKLVVEQGYQQPAIVHREGWELELLSSETSVPNQAHLDDAVDELIEMTIEKGGEVAFVDEGMLAEHNRIALILRY